MLNSHLFNSIVLRGTNNAISNVVRVAEVVKHRVLNLHQTNKLSSIDVEDVYEPNDLNSGLEVIKIGRILVVFEVRLSLIEPKVKDMIGY